MPAPTKWPMLLAAGFVLALASLITNYWIGTLGLALIGFGATGWFRDVLPRELHESVKVRERLVPIIVSGTKVERIELGESHRAQLPLKTYPVLSGIKGGIAGGIAMIIPAELYGILRFHSIWYVVNLLGGAGVAGWKNPTLQQMEHFKLSAFIIAVVIQCLTSLLVGLLYGAILPLWPSRPILLGGLLAPAAWTGLVHSVLGLVNPFLDARIDWWSFAASQVLFGVVAGYTVSRSSDLKALAQAPLDVRMGVQSAGLRAGGKESHQ